MAGENEGFLESKIQELYSTLHGWYTDSWGCRGLNNDEIDEEFAGLLNDVEEAECTCDSCKGDLLGKYMGILTSRTKITKTEKHQMEFSLSMAINSLAHFAEVNNYCPCCAPAHATEELIDSYYWMGVLIGSIRERADYGISKAARNASDVRHSFNRERRLKVQDWYRGHRKNYNNKDDAARDGEHIFNLSFSCIRKYLRNQ